AYTRHTTGSSLAKTTTFQSDRGSVTLGTVNGGKDAITVRAPQGNISIDSSLSTAGSVTVTAGTGNITVNAIDTTSGTGAVALSALNGTVGARMDTVGLEVTSGSTIAVTGKTIGTPAFGNPLDMAGSAVTLSSTGAGGRIGFAGAPIVANTQDLTIIAADSSQLSGTNGAQFNVSTGSNALQNLDVTANPAAVGNGGLAQVRTEAGGPGDRTYMFPSDGTNFALNIGSVPTSQFAGGLFSFTTTAGNVALGDANTGA